MTDWIRQMPVQELTAALPQISDEEAMTDGARRFAQSYPVLIRLIPALLDRGDSVGREFVLPLALLLRTPEMNDALRAFCMSPRGPDALRTQTMGRGAARGRLKPGLQHGTPTLRGHLARRGVVSTLKVFLPTRRPAEPL